MKLIMQKYHAIGVDVLWHKIKESNVPSFNHHQMNSDRFISLAILDTFNFEIIYSFHNPEISFYVKYKKDLIFER